MSAIPAPVSPASRSMSTASAPMRWTEEARAILIEIGDSVDPESDHFHF